MIPYEELVIALQTWRAKQGLPIAQMSGQLPMPVPVPTSARTSPPAAPRTNPPGAPPRAPAVADDHLDVEDAGLLEEAAYENEGDDFAVGFGAKPGANAEHDEQTAIGGAPTPGPAPTGKRSGGNRNEDW